MGVIIVIVVVALSAVICHHVAKSRGANPVFWGVMGLVFGPLAIPLSFFARPGRE